MEIAAILLKEFEQETLITRKFLEHVPFNKLDWQPHSKSMRLGNLAFHLAGLASWVSLAINSDSLDLASPANKPLSVDTNEELLLVFDDLCQKGKRILLETKEQELNKKLDREERRCHSS